MPFMIAFFAYYSYSFSLPYFMRVVAYFGTAVSIVLLGYYVRDYLKVSKSFSESKQPELQK